LEREQDGLLLEDHSLLAMAAYTRLLSDWQPAASELPALLVRASTPMIELADGHEGERDSWLPRNRVEIAADHFSIVEQHAELAAHVAETWLPAGCWLGARPARPPAGGRRL